MADAVTIALDDGNPIAVFTNDEDVVPALLLASRHSRGVLWIRFARLEDGAPTPGHYDRLVESNNVTIISMEA